MACSRVNRLPALPSSTNCGSPSAARACETAFSYARVERLLPGSEVTETTDRLGPSHARRASGRATSRELQTKSQAQRGAVETNVLGQQMR